MFNLADLQILIGDICSADKILRYHAEFASLTAYTSALLPVLLTVAIAVPEIPVKLISLLFCYTLGLIDGHHFEL